MSESSRRDKSEPSPPTTPPPVVKPGRKRKQIGVLSELPSQPVATTTTTSMGPPPPVPRREPATSSTAQDTSDGAVVDQRRSALIAQQRELILSEFERLTHVLLPLIVVAKTLAVHEAQVASARANITVASRKQVKQEPVDAASSVGVDDDEIE